MKYLVRWEIDSDAATPLEAAREARAAQLEPGSIATIFDVFPVHPAGCLGDSTRIDLEELTTEEEAEANAGIIPHDPQAEQPEEKQQYRNYYLCTHEGTKDSGKPVTEWHDDWSATCNDRCPLCNLEVEPYHSEDLTTKKPFTCRGCGREERECSANPCAGVIADREAAI